MTRNRPSPAVDQSVAVTVPAHLQGIVAGYLVERAADYEGGRIPEGLVALAAQVGEPKVVVPAHLRVVVANYLVERACDFSEHSNEYEDLTALATEVNRLTVTGRA